MKDLAFFGAEAERLFGEAVTHAGASGTPANSTRAFPRLRACSWRPGWPNATCHPRLFDAQSDKVFPPVREIIAGGRAISAADTYAHLYKLRAFANCDAV
jgi:allophanate hydrolase